MSWAPRMGGEAAARLLSPRTPALALAGLTLVLVVYVVRLAGQAGDLAASRRELQLQLDLADRYARALRPLPAAPLLAAAPELAAASAAERLRVQAAAAGLISPVVKSVESRPLAADLAAVRVVVTASGGATALDRFVRWAGATRGGVVVDRLVAASPRTAAPIADVAFEATALVRLTGGAR